MSDGKIRGVVHQIDETKTYGQKGFRKRQVVLEQNNDRFTNYVPVEFIQDGCDTVDDLKVGDDVEVTYRLSGRKWQRDAHSEVKFFVNVEATGFRVVNDQAGADPGTADDPFDQAGADAGTANDQFDQAAADEDEVPF
jgi:hypothetical protein